MGRLTGKKILIIVGQKNYNDKEFEQLSEKLSSEGAEVLTASNSMEKALGRLQGFVSPNFAISEVNPEEFDAIVLVGGYGARVYLWDNKELHQFLQAFSGAGKVLASCSNATVCLANAGLLEGRKATVFPDYDSTLILQQKNAILVQEHLVADDNILTCRHPQFVPELAEALIKKLHGD